MSVYSKFFNKLLGEYDCSKGNLMYKPYPSIWHVVMDKSVGAFIGTCQFYLPLYFLPLLASRSNFTREKLSETFRIFFDSVWLTYITAGSAYLLCLLTYKVTGKYTYRSIVQLPTMVGALWIFVCNNRKVHLMFAHTLAVIMFEVFIRSGAIAPLKWIRDSTTMRMMTFMTMSAFILDAVQNAVGHPDDYLPWLVKPIRKRGDFDDTRHSKQSIFDKFLPRSNHVCLHSSSCGEYLWEAIKVYSTIGCGMEMAKNIVSRPKAFLRKPWQHFNWGFLAFTAGYPALYRLVDCCLNRFIGHPTRIGHASAAFVGALPFYYYQEMQIFTHAISCALELIWSRFVRKYEAGSTLQRMLFEMPMAKITHCILLGTMFHVRIFYPWLGPKMLLRAADMLTNNTVQIIAKNVHSLWLPV